MTSPQPYPYGSYESVLSGLRSGGLGDVLGSPIHIETLEEIRRPYSKIVRIRVRHGSGTTDAYVKLLRLKENTEAHREAMRARIAKEFDVASLVHQEFSASGWPAVRPLACVANEFALVTEQVEGKELLGVLERDSGWYPGRDRMAMLDRLLRSSGAWVRRFQALKVPDRIVSIEELREYLDIRLVRLVQHGGASFSTQDRTRVLKYFDDKSSEVNPGDLRGVIVHADYGPSNVIASGDQVAVLDFAMAQVGTRFHDLARMYTQLELLTAKPQFLQRTVVRLQRALLEGYETGLTAEHPLLDLLILQNRLTHLLMTVAETNGGLLARAYNRHLARRARRWAHAKTALAIPVREH